MFMFMFMFELFMLDLGDGWYLDSDAVRALGHLNSFIGDVLSVFRMNDG